MLEFEIRSVDELPEWTPKPKLFATVHRSMLMFRGPTLEPPPPVAPPAPFWEIIVLCTLTNALFPALSPLAGPGKPLRWIVDFSMFPREVPLPAETMIPPPWQFSKLLLYAVNAAPTDGWKFRHCCEKFSMSTFSSDR